MRFVVPFTLLIINATAFSFPSLVKKTSSLNMSASTKTSTFTFSKSEEVFAEAQTVSILSFLNTVADIDLYLKI